MKEISQNTHPKTFSRLDVYLVDNGFTISRTKASQLIEDGQVLINGQIAKKTSQKVASTDKITVKSAQYVARSAYKLLGLLKNNAISNILKSAIKEGVCLDIGASTGGFVQVLLEHNARAVIALDVGHDQLADIVKEDPRVTNMEGVNFRDVDVCDFNHTKADKTGFDIVTCDVSFISLKNILPKLFNLLKNFDDLAQNKQNFEHCSKEVYIILLVKPQFEVGVDVLSNFSDGVITDTALIRYVVDNIRDYAVNLGFEIIHLEPAGITGKKGNQEWVMVMTFSKDCE